MANKIGNIKLVDQLGEDTRSPIIEKPTPDNNHGDSNNKYVDPNDFLKTEKPEYTPNQEGLKNTGQGAASALGSQYSWDQKGAQAAQTQYQSDIKSTQQNALANRETIESNAVNYQTNADMMKYQNQQEAEKVGWTGGYVLDQNRQMEYLKQSIQAQMYGAMELQKYGYDTSLAAARLSYDLNQKEYARQYYNDAVSAALSEAQLTGTYFSAETRDMLSQRAVAEQILKDKSATQDDKNNASKLIASINGWFNENGISESGVKTMEAWEREVTLNTQWREEQWTKYQAALEAAQADLTSNATMFIKVNENGDPLYTGQTIETLDFSTANGQTMAEYIVDENGKVNEKAKQQLYSYFNYVINNALNQYKNSVMTKDANGNVTYNVTSQGVEKALTHAYKVLEKYKYEDSAAYKTLYDEYTFSSTDPIFNINEKNIGNLEEYKNNIKEDDSLVNQNNGNAWDPTAKSSTVSYYNKEGKTLSNKTNDVFGYEGDKLLEVSNQIPANFPIVLTNGWEDHLYVMKTDEGKFVTLTQEQAKTHKDFAVIWRGDKYKDASGYPIHTLTSDGSKLYFYKNVNELRSDIEYNQDEYWRIYNHLLGFNIAQ